MVYVRAADNLKRDHLVPKLVKHIEITTNSADWCRRGIEILKTQVMQEKMDRHLKYWQLRSCEEKNLVSGPRDNYTTPSWLKDRVVKRAMMDPGATFDPFLFNPDWKRRVNYDGFRANWPHRDIFVNPPFSMTQLAIIWSLIQFLNGRNIVLICMQSSYEGQVTQEVGYHVTHAINEG